MLQKLLFLLFLFFCLSGNAAAVSHQSVPVEQTASPPTVLKAGKSIKKQIRQQKNYKPRRDQEQKIKGEGILLLAFTLLVIAMLGGLAGLGIGLIIGSKVMALWCLGALAGSILTGTLLSTLGFEAKRIWDWTLIGLLMGFPLILALIGLTWLVVSVFIVSGVLALWGPGALVAGVCIWGALVGYDS